MTGIYLSGTGNTKHCIEKLLSIIEPGAKAVPIESEEAVKKIIENEIVILAYPTQFSNVPFMVRDFIRKNPYIWKDKKILCMTTMGAFSGDGAGCAARVLKKYGAEIIGGLHIKMPDAVCDSKLLKKSLEENRRIIMEADERIEKIGTVIRDKGIYPKDGLSFFAHLAGLFGQRLWFYNKTTDYSSRLKISDNCTGCGLCAQNCPMKNIEIIDGKARAKGDCAMCYRCISTCPKQALTLLGKEVFEQCRYEKYAEN
ncbi:MAG: EFR1 family ferrodoxin [Lachnospiraceae bacterium]|nr:EFR1 family ferrodoxin [Lachnospiraceae bacterium]